ADTLSVHVVVRPDGLLPPLGPLALADAVPALPSHAARAGSVVPLKLRLMCGAAAVGAGVAAPRLTGLTRDGSAIDLAVLDSGSGIANDSGTSFRLADGQWIYNLGTRGLSAGQYRVTIDMPDGRRW